jgi:hypothetical protein
MILVSYSILKSRRADLNLGLFHIELLAADGTTVRGYIVFAAATGYYLKTEVQAGSGDFDDFVANLLSSSVSVQSDSDVLARIAAPQAVGLAGLPVVTMINVPVAAANYKKSWQVTAPPNATTIKDICICDDLVGPQGRCYIVGGTYKCRTDAVEGSVLEFAMVDRDDVTGFFQLTRMFLTNVTGSVAAGLSVVGQTSGQTAGIYQVVDASTLDVVFSSGDFSAGETLKFYQGVQEVGTATLAMAVKVYDLHRTSMVLSSVVGTIAVGDIATGATSGQTSRVLEIVDATHIEITFANGPFQDGEDVSFSGGATAHCDDWIEGDVLYLARSVDDEWIEKDDEGGFQPGDSRALVQGLYFRVVVFNASTTDNLRMRVALEMGKE